MSIRTQLFGGVIHRNQLVLNLCSLVSSAITPKSMTTVVAECDLEAARRNLPPALEEGKHKGQAGRIGICGGSREYTGAPYYAGISALKCGADLTYIFCMKEAAAPIKSYSPELIVLPFLDDEHGRGLTKSRLLNLHSLVIGPGLGENVHVHEVIVSIVKYIKEHTNSLSKISLVFDADGIGLLTDNKEILFNYPGFVYITPNANEIKKLAFAYLGRRDVNTEDDASLMQLASRIHENVIIILKGVKDKIITKDGVYCCSVAGSFRRVGGQGDLLSGSLGLFAYWATLYRERATGQSSSPTIPAEIIAGYSACSMTRLCNRFAYEENGRSMMMSDMIAQMHKAYTVCFG